MTIDSDTSADEIGKAFATLARAAGALPDSIDIWRAIHDWREWKREGSDTPQPSAQAAILALMLDANSVILEGQSRLVEQWQRLMACSLPRIRERLEDYRAEPDPLPELREHLIDEIRSYLGALGDLAMDHGRDVKEDFDKLERRFFCIEEPDVGPVAAAGRQRGARVARR